MADEGAQDRSEAEWVADPLGFLLDPIAPETFLNDHYERSHLLVAGRAPDRFGDLLSLDAVDAFIDGADIRAGMLDLVRNTGRIAADRYTSSDGRVIPSAVAGEYLNGATIILPQLHGSMPRLGQLCRALEAAMSCHVQANVYLTPPGNQGFGVHHDNHDVLVMQVHGSKSWRLYGPPGSPMQQDCTLGPGDCLYVPSGLMHEAINVGGEPSLHITLGLITASWADLIVEALAQAAHGEPALRRALPPGFARPGFDRAAARERFGEMLALVAGKADADDALDRLAANFLRERRPQVTGVIAAGPRALRIDGRFRSRALVQWRLAEQDGKPIVVGPGGDLAFDEGDRRALERALSGLPFSLHDLECPDPSRMLRILWSNGYLEFAGPDADDR